MLVYVSETWEMPTEVDSAVNALNALRCVRLMDLVPRMLVVGNDRLSLVVQNLNDGQRRRNGQTDQWRRDMTDEQGLGDDRGRLFARVGHGDDGGEGERRGSGRGEDEHKVLRRRIGVV
jgi:hypothetical protein